MKKVICTLAAILLLLSGCSSAAPAENGITATTLPVYQFTSLLCQGTGIPVTRLVTENVSCLHDYSLKVSQVKAIESARVVVISGAGLEEFMEDVLSGRETIDASLGIPLLESCHEDGHEGHHHQQDAHIWLSPLHALTMTENICRGLQQHFPAHADTFESNLQLLRVRLQALLNYGRESLSGLSPRQLVTFHDGFSYFAQCFDLEILRAIEEESGSEASAKELIELITLVRAYDLPGVFIEENGSVSAAGVIAAETDTKIFTLSMAMAGEDYFSVMYHNIDTIREALQ